MEGVIRLRGFCPAIRALYFVFCDFAHSQGPGGATLGGFVLRGFCAWGIWYLGNCVLRGLRDSEASSEDRHIMLHDCTKTCRSAGIMSRVSRKPGWSPTDMYQFRVVGKRPKTDTKETQQRRVRDMFEIRWLWADTPRVM